MYLTLEEAAERLGVEYKTIYRLVRTGEIPAGKVGRIYRIYEGDLDAYFERQKQLVSRQAERSGLTALEGRRCGACDKPILSELSVAGHCEQCRRDICQACWAIRKIRRCSEHGHRETTNVQPEAGTARAQSAAHPRSSATAQQRKEDPAAVVERLHNEGRPAVSAKDARLCEEAFLRAFAQRLETIEELRDPLGGLAVLLRKSRVKHAIEPQAESAGSGPRNLLSRFTLKTGGWGRRGTSLVLEARFASRPDAYATTGYDAAALGESELSPLLGDLRRQAKQADCFHVVTIGSPTGWTDAAIRLVTQRHRSQSFHDRRVAVGLFDLFKDESFIDEGDDRLRPFWPLVAPGRFAAEKRALEDAVRALVERYEHVSLDYAAQRSHADRSWVRTVFRELERSGGFHLEERTEEELTLSRT